MPLRTLKPGVPVNNSFVNEKARNNINQNFGGVAREQLKPIDVINQGEAEAVKLKFKIFLNDYLQRAAAQTESRCADKPKPRSPHNAS